MKATLLIEVEYDEEVMHGDEPDAVEWFYEEILKGDTGQLILHSNNIGDSIGTVTVLDNYFAARKDSHELTARTQEGESDAKFPE